MVKEIRRDSSLPPDNARNNEIVGRDYTDLCVISTIESMLSSLAGNKITLSDRFLELRREHLEEHRKKVATQERNVIEERYGVRPDSPSAAFIWEAIDNDHDQTRALIEEVMLGDDEAGVSLKNSEIRFEKCDFSAAESFVQEGWEVGISTSVSTLGANIFHMLHLGIFEGELADMSNNQGPKPLTTSDIWHHNKTMENYLKYTNSPNIIMFKKKQ